MLSIWPSTSPAVAGVCDFDLDFGAVSVALSPDGRYVYAGNYIVDVQDPNQPVTTGVRYNGINGAFSGDGRHLYTWGPGFNVYEFSSSSGFCYLGEFGCIFNLMKTQTSHLIINMLCNDF